MYTLMDNGVITEVSCGNNFEYVLANNSHFLNTDYKVLQSQKNGIFIQCMKMTRNGKTSLYYITNEYRPMSSIFAGITADMLITIVINLLASVIEVRNNGFLACQCIDLSWNKIYVEQNTLKVKLIYLPISVKAFDSYVEFESELRSGIVKLINKEITDMNERVNQVVVDLCNGSLSLDDVYNKLRNTGTYQMAERMKPNLTAQHSSNSIPIKLVAMNAPSHFELVIDKSNVLIGKKQGLVDKVISFNNMISRKHCRITNVDGMFYINDEGSANGTYVNGAKLRLGEKIQIDRGDIIRLANSDFQIV